MADVFISYAHQDKGYADGRGLERVLKAKSPEVSYWLDTRINAGAAWSDDIAQRLRACRCVVVIWSKNSWASPWVRQEAFYGYMRGILVPLLVDDVMLEPPFNSVQCARNNETGFDALVAGIRAKLAV